MNDATKGRCISIIMWDAGLLVDVLVSATRHLSQSIQSSVVLSAVAVSINSMR